jgi:nucleoside 2-deoxyribosyltransferase
MGHTSPSTKSSILAAIGCWAALVLLALGATDLTVGFSWAHTQNVVPVAKPAERVTSVYLAGPLGFSEAGRDFQERVLLPELKRFGFEVINPWKLTEQGKIDGILAMPYGEARRDAWRKLNVEIGRNNQDGIDRADAILAILDGVDVDSGTASEIGYAFARNKRILGYRGDFRLSADNEGSVVNLQVEYFIRASGGDIVSSVAELEETFSRLKQ